MIGHVVTDTAAIVEVLESDRFVPPPAVPGPSGETRALRDAMARFAAPAVHPARRAAVEAAIRMIDVDESAEVAARLTHERLVGECVDAVAAIATRVPVETLAACLAVDAEPADVVRDVDAVVAVIGRGRPASPDSDAATIRLLRSASTHPAGSVPVVSTLYQSMDATAALILTSLHSRALGTARSPAIPRTTRTAIGRTGLPDGTTVAAGDMVTVEIGSAGLEFGAGPHRCPGRDLAERLAASVVAAVDDAGYEADPASVEVDVDGRPATLSLRPISS